MIKFEDLLIFVSTADSGSLSSAARQLDVTASVASVGLKRLEAELGVQLLARSTRNLRLTPEGERYLAYARNILQEVEAGQHAVAHGRNAIGGTLSISLPSDLGRNVLINWLDAFQTLHPNVSIQVRIGDQVTNMFSDPIDLALRYGMPEDSTLIALPLAPENRRVLCAAPSYLEEHGKPLTPDDLARHNCLRFALNETIYDRWMFYADGQGLAVQVRGNRSSNDGELVRRWAIAGYGLAYKSRLDVLSDLRSGTLVPLMTNFEGESAPLSLVCAHRLMLSPTIHALRDFLRDQMARYLGGMQ